MNSDSTNDTTESGANDTESTDTDDYAALEARVRDLEVEVYGYDPEQSAGDGAMVDVKRTIVFLDNRLGDDEYTGVPIGDIYQVAGLIGLSQPDAEEAYEQLKRHGEVYEPIEGEVCPV